MNSRDTEHIIAELSKDNQYTTTQTLAKYRVCENSPE